MFLVQFVISPVFTLSVVPCQVPFYNLQFWRDIYRLWRYGTAVLVSVMGAVACINSDHKSVGNLIVATIYLQLIPNRYMFRSFTVLQCSHQHCVQPVASDVEVVGYL